MTLMDVLFVYACPLAGCFLAFVLYFSPVRDMRAALKRGALDKLNPLPFAYANSNCLGWIVYGYYCQKFMLACSTIPGFFITLYLNVGVIKLQYHGRLRRRLERAWKLRSMDTMSTSTYSLTSEDTYETSSYSHTNKNEGIDDYLESSLDSFVAQEFLLYKLFLAWMILCVVAGFFMTEKAAQCLIGWSCNLNMCAFYGSPLQTARAVISSHGSAIIHRPMLIMTLSNAFFWVMYGLGIKDPLVYAPNALGLVFALIQTVLCIIYPACNTVADEALSLLSKPNSYTVPAEVPILVV